MKLLLAEDEKDLSSTLVKVLKIDGYDVDTAYDGEEALEMLHSRTEYDALILDVMMPKMDGFAVLEQLREEGNSIPVLMLTARAEIDDKVRGLDAGADDYLTKPFQLKELLARIRSLLRRNEKKLETYQIGNTKLVKNTYELVAESSVRLTGKEYRMMEYLIRHRGTLVSTEKLMDALWDEDSEAEINVVWAFISDLRKKLAKAGSNCSIQAVRGVGYQLVVHG